MTLYLITHQDYSEHNTTIVRGPKVKDWTEYCLSLMQRAVNNTKAQFGSWIGGSDIKTALLEELKKRGYKIVCPDEFRLNASGIIEAHDDIHLPIKIDLTRIARHNKRVRARMNRRRK